MSAAQGILRLDDQVLFDGEVWTVTGQTGAQVRLVAASGQSQLVTLSHLLAAPDFGLINAPPPPVLEPVGLLERVDEATLARARGWERHVIEIETGLPPDTTPEAAPRPEYDPARTTLAERDRAKAAELTAAGTRVSAVTVKRMRLRYREAGLYGLVDGRALNQSTPYGRADPRVVKAISTAIAGETNRSTGTRLRLQRHVRAILDEEHGTDTVPLPSRATFYRLVETLSTGHHTFGSATTRRSAANRPAGPFTPTTATRPGEIVQIDTTPLDVLAVLDDGVLGRVELTIALDVATRTICAGILRPRGTKAVDAALLLARVLVPEPLRPGWSQALAMAHSRIPHQRLLTLDARLAHAAAKPVIAPETVVVDRGKTFISETFLRACRTLGISVQPAHPGTPTDKGIVERTFGSINTLFCQHVAGYVGSNVTMRARDAESSAIWSLTELQELFDEWVVAGWQTRPHNGLRDPYRPTCTLAPNDMYSALLTAAGYLPLPLTGADYIELLPVKWRRITADGVQLDYLTYDSPELSPYRHQPSGITGKGDRWEVHYDPYDLSHVWVRDSRHGGWITVPWTHLPMVGQPFADFTWRAARQLVSDTGGDAANETAVARALNDLLTRAGQGPAHRRVLARTKAAPSALPAVTRQPDDQPVQEADDQADEAILGTVVPFGIFDPTAEDAYQ